MKIRIQNGVIKIKYKKKYNIGKMKKKSLKILIKLLILAY